MRKVVWLSLDQRVDEVLYYLWDPVGVNDKPIIRDEYASYVPGVIKKLMESDDIAAVSAFLAQIEKKYMGEIEPDKNKCDRCAAVLMYWKNALT